jgi:DNA-binding MarR family transcriptional regulator
MLPADDVGVEMVAGSLALLTRQASLMRLHDLVSARGGLVLERSAYPLLNQILALQDPATGGGRLSDVAAGLKVAVPTVSRQVRQLEELGLVVRTQDPIDGRAILLEVTDAGVDALQRMRSEWQRTVAGILESWPHKDRELLGELLERFALELLALRE